MSKIKSTIWQIEPHTEAKHEILRKYLDAWIPIISRWSSKIVFIDGFAGPGEYAGNKDGSPIIAIKAILEHKFNFEAVEFILKFIEKDQRRCEYLKNKIKGMNLPVNIKTQCVCLKFDEYINRILKFAEINKKILAPTFVFIDPFGFTGFPLSHIKKIMENEKCEVLITFMYEEIGRFISHKPLWSGLATTYGTEEWKKIFKEPNPEEKELFLRNLYKNQLERAANIKYVMTFKMKNKSNKTDYFLFFGTNNIMGLKRMKAAMWKVDKNGTFQFSDATFNPKQPMLFELEPNFDILKKIIIENFKDNAIKIQELEDFIVTHTPFRETHFKKQILVPMEKSGEIRIECSNKKRRKRTFPPECIIHFL